MKIFPSEASVELGRAPIKRMIYQVVRENPGISGPEIHKRVLSVCSSENSVSVHISQMNKRLSCHGLRIVGRPKHGYKLVEVERQCTLAA